VRRLPIALCGVLESIVVRGPGAAVERAIPARLARTLGKDEPLLPVVLDRALERIRIYRGRDPLFFTCQLAELLYEFATETAPNSPHTR